MKSGNYETKLVRLSSISGFLSYPLARAIVRLFSDYLNLLPLKRQIRHKWRFSNTQE